MEDGGGRMRGGPEEGRGGAGGVERRRANLKSVEQIPMTWECPRIFFFVCIVGCLLSFGLQRRKEQKFKRQL